MGLCRSEKVEEGQAIAGPDAGVGEYEVGGARIEVGEERLVVDSIDESRGGLPCGFILRRKGFLQRFEDVLRRRRH